MMQKIEKLLDLTIAYLERELGQVESGSYGTARAEAPPSRKPRKKATKKTTAPPPAAQGEVDPLLGAPSTPAAAKAPPTPTPSTSPSPSPTPSTPSNGRVAELAKLSDKEVTDQSNELALTYVRRFANQADGISAVQKIVRERYNILALKDLPTAERRDFIAHVETLIRQADDGVAAG